MRRSESFVMKRREDIVRLLEERGRMDVTDLAERFGVSPLTIRRDLDYLESRQLVSHQYGSATLVNTLGRPSGSRRVMAKRAIARRAAGFVEEGDAVFVNASSTALDVVNHIEAEDVSVITNNSTVSTRTRSALSAPMRLAPPPTPERSSPTTERPTSRLRSCFRQGFARSSGSRWSWGRRGSRSVGTGRGQDAPSPHRRHSARSPPARGPVPAGCLLGRAHGAPHISPTETSSHGSPATLR